MNPNRLPVADSAPYHDALARCVDHWGLVPEKTELVRDGVNHVFSTENAGGEPMIVRVSDGSERERAEIEGELIWLDHLIRHGCTVSTPVRSLNGELLETCVLPSGTFHVACFVRFGGRLLNPATDAEWNDALFLKLGREIARLHRISDALRLPRDHDRKPWHESNLSRFPDPLPAAFDPAVCARMQALTDDMRSRPTRAPHYGLVHRDLHAGNLLYEHGQIEIIDFDLGCYGWRVMDFTPLLFTHYFYPSNLVANASPRRASEVLATMVRGYREEYAMDPEQLEMVEDLLKLRSVVSYIAMAPAPEHWQVALGNPSPSVSESLRWIERFWRGGAEFGVDVRSL